MNDIINAISKLSEFCLTLIGVSMDLMVLMMYLRKLKSSMGKTKEICAYGVCEVIIVITLSLNAPLFMRLIVAIIAITILLRYVYKVIDIFVIFKLIAIYLIILCVGEVATVSSLMMFGNYSTPSSFVNNWELWFISNLMAKTICLIFIIIMERFWTNESERLNGYEQFWTLVPLIASFLVLYKIMSLMLHYDDFKTEDIVQIMVLIAIVLAIYTLVTIVSLRFYVAYKKNISEHEVLKMKNDVQLKI